MSVLVIAEHDNAKLAASTLSALTAAAQLGGELHVLVAGHDCRPVADTVAQVSGVAKVLLAEAPHYEHPTAEDVTALTLSQAAGYTHLLAAASTFGKNLMPRVAALLDVAQISEITRIDGPDTFERPIYAGNAVATVRSVDAQKVITVRASAFEPAALGGGAAPIESVGAAEHQAVAEFVSEELTAAEGPELGGARIVVSGGRGLGNGDNYRALLEPLAARLGAALGASRAAVDAGFVPNDFQVGQTGKIVAPDLYVAVGISGAIQHLAGMKSSKVIVAINKDPDAPIFQVADYGLVADLFEAIPRLTEALVS